LDFHLRFGKRQPDLSMAHYFPILRTLSPRQIMLAGMLFAATVALAFVARDRLFAQVEGDRGIAPLASTTDIEVDGVTVNVTGKTAEEAREEGWRIAQRKAWEKLGGPKISDSQLDSLVSAIVVQQEQIGPRHYIATLGVIFDRTRATQYLGAGGERARSAPMLLIPVLDSGGASMVYEMRNPWQQVWAEFQAGASAIDYVRPSGAGADSLLITSGQLGRRSRTWWRNILDQFGASDVLMAIARLERQYPGGPVKGTFTARYGPDNKFIESFTLTAPDEDGVPAMLMQARGRFDQIYTAALRGGLLQPDSTLALDKLDLSPAVKALLEEARRADAAAENAQGDSGGSTIVTTTPVQGTASFTVQFVTPDAGAVDGALASVRGTPGVQSAATTSIALGGTSVMSVSYTGGLDGLAAALRARGWQVTQGNTVLTIRR
jgi:hypothetical protein